MRKAIKKFFEAVVEDVKFVFFSGEYDEFFEDDFLTEEEIAEMEIEKVRREKEEVREEDLRPAA